MLGTLPYPTLSYPTLPYLNICSTLPYPILTYPILPLPHSHPTPTKHSVFEEEWYGKAM